MDVSYLSELENGRKEPCLRKMKEIAQALSNSFGATAAGDLSSPSEQAGRPHSGCEKRPNNSQCWNDLGRQGNT